MSAGRRWVAGRRSLAWGSAAGLAIGTGCLLDTEPELGAFVERGQHVEVWASDGIEVCGGNVAHMDRFVERFRELVGPRPEAEALHRYYVVDEEDWQQTSCELSGQGCTVKRRTVYTRGDIPHTHELVHAEIYDRRDSYLEEGIAELYGPPKLRRSPGQGTVEEGLDLRGIYIPSADYARAAHFARFIVDRHGLAGFLSARDRTTAMSDYDSVGRAFASGLGVSLDDELDAYERYPDHCLDAGYRVALVECELPVQPWGGSGEWVMSVELVCDGPDTLGPFHDEIYVLGALQIDEIGGYALDFSAPGTERGAAWIIKCDSECAELPRGDRELPFEPGFTVAAVRGGQRVEEQLYPGKYWVRLSRPSDAPGSVTLRVTKQSR